MKSLKQVQPALFVPASPADFIGPAHDVARILEAKASALRHQRDINLKYVFTGQPGIGKTKLAEFFASSITGEAVIKGQSLHVESVNGRAVDMALIRRWQSESRYVATQWVVRIVNELDTCGQDRQDLLLTYLDELGDRVAFIGTSNRKLAEMDERFQSRLQHWPIKPPQGEDIHRLIARWKLPKKTVADITLGCGGNVRAALLDTQSILDAQLV